MLRPPAHVHGELGETIFAESMVRSAWVVTRLTPDYGFDFLVQPVDRGKVNPSFALFQVKARSGPGEESAATRSVRVSSRHVELWKGTPVPAFIAYVDIDTRRIWVRNCQQIMGTLRRDAAKSVTIHFPDDAVFTDTLAERIRAAITAYWAWLRGPSESAVAAMIGAFAGPVGVMPGIWGGGLFGVIGWAATALRRRQLLTNWPQGVPSDADAFLKWMQAQHNQ